MKEGIQPDWDESPVLVPPRSRLYRLEPVGVGTSMVECLSSYIHRLAEAHGLPTWVVVCREIAPHFHRKSIAGPNGHCDLFSKMGITINGNNRSAREMVEIIESLTGRKDLRRLTFSPLGSLVAEHRIMRAAQAWCPWCLETWRTNGHAVYQPLIWILADFRACLEHGCPLEERCPACGKRHTSLLRYKWNGHCPKCKAWLGKPPPGGVRDGSKRSQGWEAFSTGALQRFVKAMQTMPVDVPCSVFRLNLIDLVQHHFNGNASALARVLRVHRTTVVDWYLGKRRPSPPSLLKLAYCFGGEAMGWLTGRMEPGDMHDTRPITQTEAESARRPLRRHPPETVRAHLSSVIQAAEYPPPSFTVVCKRLGVNQTVAKRLFPDLAVEIMSRYRLFQTESKRTREKFRRIVVESAVNQLLTEGRTLSYNQLSKVLPPGISPRDRLVRFEFKRLRKEAEDEMLAVMQESVVSSQ